jgi:hypothetical protein
MNSIKDFFVKLWNGVGQYVKIHLIGLILVSVAFIVLSLWLLPKEKQTTGNVTAKNEEIAKNYDKETDTYKDEKKVTALQNEVEEIKSDGQLTKLFKVTFISFILVTLAGFLGNFLQYIYTIVPFARLMKNEPNPDGMKVLAASLLSASLIVCFVFAMVFWI